MAAPKRTELQIQEDREFIYRQYMKGTPHMKIAEMLPVEMRRSYILTRQQVEYDLKIVKDQMHTYYKSNLFTYLSEQLAKIDLLEAEAWTAWEASKKPYKKTTVQTTKPEQPTDPNEPKPPTPAQIITVEQRDGGPGNIVYYDQIFKCVETRLKLLGYLTSSKGRTADDLNFVPGSKQDGLEDSLDDGMVVYIPHNGRDNVPVQILPQQ